MPAPVQRCLVPSACPISVLLACVDMLRRFETARRYRGLILIGIIIGIFVSMGYCTVSRTVLENAHVCSPFVVRGKPQDRLMKGFALSGGRGERSCERGLLGFGTYFFFAIITTKRESGSERPFSFASFLFHRGCVRQARKQIHSNRLRGSSRCGIRPAACSLHRNEGATGFLRLA